MDIWGVVDRRKSEVRKGILAFTVAAIVFVLLVDLLLLWLTSSKFATSQNAELLAWLGGGVVSVSLFQFFRMARDGRKLARALGAESLEDFLKYRKQHKDRATQLQNIVDELCIAANCPRPALYILDRENSINGFAAGMKPEHWCITLTLGSLCRLNRSQMQALIGHELAHLTSGDTRNSILLCSYIAGLAGVSFAGAVIAVAGGGSKEGIGFFFLGGAIAIIGGVGAIAAMLMEASLSRSQEFHADAEAVRLMRDSAGMVALLEEIAREIVAERSRERELDWSPKWDELWARPLYFSRGARGLWFQSHPPLVERIRVFDPAKAEEVERMLAGAGQ